MVWTLDILREETRIMCEGKSRNKRYMGRESEGDLSLDVKIM